MGNPNVEEKEETFLCNTMSEKKEKDIPVPSKREFNKTELFCFQAQTRELFVHKSSLLDLITENSWCILNLPGVECSMEVDTTELIPSGPSVDSADAKRPMGINIEHGVSVRAAYKAMRKRVRIDASTKGTGGRTPSRGAT